jgi:hypothetical protein
MPALKSTARNIIRKWLTFVGVRSKRKSQIKNNAYTCFRKIAMENLTENKKLVVIKTQISKAIAKANDLVIKTKEDLPKATELLSQIKVVGKMIKEQKELLTKPAKEIIDNARAFFNPVESQYTEAEKIVKEKMLAFNQAELDKAKVQTEKITEKVETGKMSFEKAADKIQEITPEKNVESKSGAVQFRTVKEVVIEDENKVPREYLMLDMVKIRKVALAGVEIAGVKVVEKQVVAGIVR